MHAHPRNLLEGDVGPHLRRLSFPLLWGMFAMTSFSVVDTFFIARLGTSALAAFSFTIPVVGFFMGVIFGISVGTTSVLSRAYGEGDADKVRQLATDSMVMMTILSALAAVAGYFLIDSMAVAMGARQGLLPLIHDFMAIWYCGMVFLGLFFCGNAIIRASGDTRTPSMLMGMVAVLNAIVDPFLIFGWGPFPEMGLNGAALTLVIANLATCGCSLYILIVKKKILSPILFHDGTLAAWKRVLHVGVPSIASNLINPLSTAVITWIAARLGKEAVAALGVSMRIEGLALMVFFALGVGISIFTGQNFGAGNYGRVTEASRYASRYAILWSIAVAILFWIFASDIPLAFDRHPEVVFYTSQYLHIVPFSYAAMGVMIIVNSSLNAMGKPLGAAMIVLLRTFIIYVPVAYFAVEAFGFVGILWALAFTNVVAGIVSYVWNRAVTP